MRGYTVRCYTCGAHYWQDYEDIDGCPYCSEIEEETDSALDETTSSHGQWEGE